MKEGKCCIGEYGGSHGAGPFFGRLLISLIFILAGIGKIADFPGTVNAIRGLGLPWPEVLTVIALIMEIVGGVLLLIGWQTRFAIYLLMIFLLPTTLLFHPFWKFQGVELHIQMANFLKNLAIYGGFILLLSYGPGHWSLDACNSKKKV